MARLMFVLTMLMSASAYSASNPIAEALLEYAKSEIKFDKIEGSTLCGDHTWLALYEEEGSLKEIRFANTHSYFHFNTKKMNTKIKPVGDITLEGIETQKTDGGRLILQITEKDEELRMNFFESLIYDHTAKTLGWTSSFDIPKTGEYKQDCVYKLRVN